MIPPSSLIIFQGWGLIDLPLRASNEGLRRPRVARAQQIISLHPLLVPGAGSERVSFSPFTAWGSASTETMPAVSPLPLPARTIVAIEPREAAKWLGPRPYQIGDYVT